MAETIIGPQIQIDGDIVGEDPVTVLGQVKNGKIAVNSAVLVASSGRVDGAIEALSIEVAGAVQGNVSASDKVELKAGGQLSGDLKAPRILIADGASFKGNINMGG